MGDVYRQTNVGKVETVAQSNQSQGNDVVCDQLSKVLARFLQLQKQHNRLLGPVTRLEEIVCLEQSLVLAMRESLEHGSRVKVPEGRALHHVQAEWTKDTKVDRGVHLLHEPSRLALTPDPGPDRERADHLLHDKLARERQDDGVEGHERDILLSLAVHYGPAGGFRRQGVGEEDGAMHRVGRGRVDGIQRKQEDDDQKREEPGILQTGIGEAVQERAIAAALRLRLAGGLFWGAVLQLLEREGSSRQRKLPGRGDLSIRTLPRSGDVGSIGLTSFMVDMAGALVSPRMSTPRWDVPRGRTMAGEGWIGLGMNRGESRNRCDTTGGSTHVREREET